MRTRPKTGWLALLGTLWTAGAALALPPLPSLPLTVRDSWCTTEPAQPQVRLRALKAGAGQIRVAVTARGELCRGPWVARREDQRIVLAAQQRRVEVASSCGTCGSTIEIADLPPGDYTLLVEGSTLPLMIRAR